MFVSHFEMNSGRKEEEKEKNPTDSHFLKTIKLSEFPPSRLGQIPSLIWRNKKNLMTLHPIEKWRKQKNPTNFKVF